MEYWNIGINGILEEWKDGTFEQTCLRKLHERVVGRIVGANNSGKEGIKGIEGIKEL